MPKPDMSGWKSEGQKAALAEQKRKSRIYANYNYDPKEKLAAYEKAMRSIYAKSLMLDAIAQFTGGKSQAKRFVDMATARLEMEEKFDDQERLLNIQRGVYYDENGVYDPPKNQQEAFERVLAFGGSPALAEKIAGYSPKEDKRAWVNWYNPITGQTDTLRSGDKPKGKGWILGKKPGEDGGDTSLKLMNHTRTLMAERKFYEAYQTILSYYMGKRPESYGGQATGNLGEKTRAVQYVFGMLPPQDQAALTIPNDVKSEEELAQWEAQKRSEGYANYPYQSIDGRRTGFVGG